MHRLEGGCQVPIAAHALLDGETLKLDGLVASVDGKRVIRRHINGLATEAHQLGTTLAERLCRLVETWILKEIYGRA